jgi:hypothetical protein
MKYRAIAHSRKGISAMRGNGHDTGKTDPAGQDDGPPEDPEPEEGDTVIELIDGVPYIYEQNAENEAKMAKIRDHPTESSG